MEIEAPKEVAEFLVEKGSIAVDGISLTVNNLSGAIFSILLIPETQKRTTLASKKSGDAVNLEADIIGKYVARLLKKGQGTKGLTFEEAARRRLLTGKRPPDGKTSFYPA